MCVSRESRLNGVFHFGTRSASARVDVIGRRRRIWAEAAPLVARGRKCLPHPPFYAFHWTLIFLLILKTCLQLRILSI